MNEETSVAIDHRQLLEDFEAALFATGVGFDPPVDHYFAKGLYGRRIYVGAGVCVSTYVHNVEHIAIALVGDCLVIREDGTKQTVSAPAVFITQPGTKRAVFTLTDTEWVTVHATDKTTVEDVESEIFSRTFAEFDQRFPQLPHQEVPCLEQS